MFPCVSPLPLTRAAKKTDERGSHTQQAFTGLPGTVHLACSCICPLRRPARTQRVNKLNLSCTRPRALRWYLVSYTLHVASLTPPDEVRYSNRRTRAQCTFHVICYLAGCSVWTFEPPWALLIYLSHAVLPSALRTSSIFSRALRPRLRGFSCPLCLVRWSVLLHPRSPHSALRRRQKVCCLPPSGSCLSMRLHAFPAVIKPPVRFHPYSDVLYSPQAHATVCDILIVF